jgi:hypothetical protein
MKYGFTILGEGSKSNGVFNLTRDAISAKQKVLKKQGKGNKPKKSQPLTDDEINMLYQKKLLGESTPESLLCVQTECFHGWICKCDSFFIIVFFIDIKGILL